MNATDKTGTLDLLEGAAAGNADRAERLETHVSVIVLGQDRAFKLKKAVRLPYLDFSTPELRLAACEAELALNRRTAPSLYLGVRRITRAADGALALDGAGELVDAVVEMKRFEAAGLLDTMAAEGRLTPAVLTTLAERIANFHAAAPLIAGADATASISAALDANEGGFLRQTILDPAATEALMQALRARAAALAPLLARRGAMVRRCHGDLHLRNICLVDGVPTLFDCLEFSDDLATIDVLYDLAFLLMDLWHRGLQAEASLVTNRYLDRSGDEGALALLPFYMAVRAAVRAHVVATQAGAERTGVLAEQARGYLDLAVALLAPQPPLLVAVGGLSGAGKSTVAAALAPRVGAPPGGRVLSTDRLRKALFGRAALDRLPPEAYGPEVSTRVYARQRELSALVLAGGGSVVADGVFLREDERRSIETIAGDAGVGFTGLWLSGPKEVLAARVSGRTNDPSDATAAVLEDQMQLDPGRILWHEIFAAGTAEETCNAACAALADTRKRP